MLCNCQHARTEADLPSFHNLKQLNGQIKTGQPALLVSLLANKGQYITRSHLIVLMFLWVFLRDPYWAL